MPKLFGFCHLSVRAKMLLVIFLAVFLVSGSVIYVEAYTRLKPIYEVSTSKKIIALTFDISWGNKTPEPVLQVLQQNDIRCTFFLSGPWVKQHPKIAQSIVKNGHEIGSHGYRHINLSNLSKSEIKEEINKAHQFIKDTTGVKPTLIRTPNGDYSNHVIEGIHECGYEAIQWGTDSLDWMNPGVKTIVDRVTKKVHPGDIILMHASDTCKQTAEALPQIIENLKKQGYSFVTVSELLKEENKN